MNLPQLVYFTNLYFLSVRQYGHFKVQIKLNKLQQIFNRISLKTNEHRRNKFKIERVCGREKRNQSPFLLIFTNETQIRKFYSKN